MCVYMFTSVMKTNHVYGPINLLIAYIVNRKLICNNLMILRCLFFLIIFFITLLIVSSWHISHQIHDFYQCSYFWIYYYRHDSQGHTSTILSLILYAQVKLLYQCACNVLNICISERFVLKMMWMLKNSGAIAISLSPTVALRCHNYNNKILVSKCHSFD